MWYSSTVVRSEASSNLKVHEVAGMPVPELRPATYKAAVSGWYNKDEEDGRRKKLRQAVTLTHMEMMKLLLKVNAPFGNLGSIRSDLTDHVRVVPDVRW